MRPQSNVIFMKRRGIYIDRSFPKIDPTGFGSRPRPVSSTQILFNRSEPSVSNHFNVSRVVTPPTSFNAPKSPLLSSASSNLSLILTLHPDRVPFNCDQRCRHNKLLTYDRLSSFIITKWTLNKGPIRRNQPLPT